MSAFADLLVTFGQQSGTPKPRRAELPWRVAGALPGVWNATLAVAPGSPLVQTREVSPWSIYLLGELARYDSLAAPADPLGAFVMDLRSGKERAE